MKLGRNDTCYCGSGKKYKNCCLKFDQNPILAYESKLEGISTGFNNDEMAKRVFTTVLEYMRENAWEGSCHATSSILYILFSELGLPAKLNIGEVYYNPSFFDHSWVTVNEKIYDAALSITLDNKLNNPPVFDGIDLKTGEECKGLYGVFHDGLGSPANNIVNLTIGKYFNEFPYAEDGLWTLTKLISQRAGMIIDIEGIKGKYSNNTWTYIKA